MLFNNDKGIKEITNGKELFNMKTEQLLAQAHYGN